MRLREWWHRWRDWRSQTSYATHVQRWGTLPLPGKDQITPLLLPPIRPLRAQKVEETHVVQGRFGS